MSSEEDILQKGTSVVTDLKSWLTLNGPQEEHLDENPLTLALFEVRFPRVLKASNKNIIEVLQDKVIEEYPLLFDAPIEVDEKEGYLVQWRFADTDDNWSVGISEDRFGIETRRYSSFEEFEARTSFWLDLLATHINPRLVTRIGVRYINEIRSSTSLVGEWLDSLNPKLLGLLAEEQFVASTTNSISRVDLRGPDNFEFVINAGMVPKGFVVNPQRVLPIHEEPFFLLDMDISQTSPPGEFVFDRTTLLGQLDEMHDVISRVFHWAVRG